MKASPVSASSKVKHPALKRLEVWPVTEFGEPRMAFNRRDTAKILGVSENAVKELVKAGYLKRLKALRKAIIPRAEIERFLQAVVG